MKYSDPHLEGMRAARPFTKLMSDPLVQEILASFDQTCLKKMEYVQGIVEKPAIAAILFDIEKDPKKRELCGLPEVRQLIGLKVGAMMEEASWHKTGKKGWLTAYSKNFQKGEIYKRGSTEIAAQRPLDVWIGSEYKKPENGILILAESTYGEDEPLAIAIPNWIKGSRDQTFSRVYNAFYGYEKGKDTTKAKGIDRQQFWNLVAYCNFVQPSIGEKRSTRPTAADYTAATVVLSQVLKQVQAKGVLVLGAEQSTYSEPVVRSFGIPCVTARHPTGYGVSTEELQGKWKELINLIAKTPQL